MAGHGPFHELSMGLWPAFLTNFEADFKQQQSEMINKVDEVLKAMTDQIMGVLPSDTVKNPKLNILSARSYPTTDPQCSTSIRGSIKAITLCSREELEYHKYLMSGQIPSLFFRNPIIIGGCLANLKIPCNLGHVHVEKAYIDLNSPLNIMTRMLYNWIRKEKLGPRELRYGRISNFTGRVRGMHIFVGNFTYVSNFMIVEDISSIVDPMLSQVILGRLFMKVSGMTCDLSEGLARFTNGNDEVAYKMPHKIEQYSSLSDLKKEHTKSVYFRNEDDKRRGVDYVMKKILSFYKECLELGPENVTGLDGEGGVT
ncbi:retrotransposon ORF1 [Tanacetum coccineum]